MGRFPFVLLSILLLALGCTVEQEDRMQDFERPLLLTWIAVQDEDWDAASNYSNALQTEWAALQADYGNLANDAEWRQYFRAIDLWQEKLVAAIQDRELREAESRIYQIQDELSSLRLRYGILSPADPLYDFRRRWDSVVQISYDPMLCRYEWGEFETIVAEAEQSWQHFLAVGPAYYPELFPTDPARRNELNALADQLSQRIADYRRLLREGDQTLAQEPSQEIRQLFYEYLAILTGFPRRERVIG
jgi:hypothetical protein